MAHQSGSKLSSAKASGSGSNVALLLKSARQQLEQGSFKQAKASYQRCLQLDPENGRALFALSALARRAGQRKLGRSLLERAGAAEPVQAPLRHDPNLPTVVRTRCLASADLVVRLYRRIKYRLRYSEGHFALENLLFADRLNMYVANLVRSADPLHLAPEPDLYLNTVGCADRGRQTLLAMADFFAERPHIPVINRPEAVLETSRDGNYRRLNAIENLRFPKTERIRVESPVPELVKWMKAEFELPVIIRVAGMQTGRGVTLCRDWLAVRYVLEQAPPGQDLYVIQFVDGRQGGGVYRKARVFFIDGHLYPVAYLANDDWQIHAGDRYRVMLGNEALQQEERQYLADPEAVVGAKAWRALHDVASMLQLDFAGADFTVLPDGTLFVFEANSTMRHNFNHTPSFPYTEPYLERIRVAFDTMVHDRIGRHRAGARSAS